MSREPEWDDEQRDIALEMLRYERETCPDCGGHFDHTRDKSVARDVQDVESVCLDCEAIAQVRELHHAKHGKDECDCHKRVVWVDRYIPIP